MNGDLLRLAESIQRDRDIAIDDVLSAIETALASACRKNFRIDGEVDVAIDRETGEISAQSLDDATEISTDALGRIAAQTAKQVMMQKIREAESGVVFDNFRDRNRTIASGGVIRTEGSTVVIKLGKTEAFLPDYEQVSTERYYPGDRIRVLILDVRKVGSRVKIIVSRTHPDLVRKLFEMEIPEIHDEDGEIKRIAREPGKRSKIAVFSSNPNCDCVGACLGVRGMRVRNIISELREEKLDVIRWSEDQAEYIKSSLKPAQVLRMILYEARKHAVVLVAPDQLSIAIGRGGQNVRLASKLVGWEIDVMTPEECEQKFMAERKKIMELPGVGEKMLSCLMEAGYTSVSLIAHADEAELSSIRGLGQKTAEHLIATASDMLGSGSREKASKEDESKEDES